MPTIKASDFDGDLSEFLEGRHADARESTCPMLEKHLLICQSCRDRLQATDAYVVPMH
jgi:hypothetical protein